MIESIEFKNFKALRDTTLPLAPCTVIVGPNGSGKSTVLQALEAVRQPGAMQFARTVSFGAREDANARVSVKLVWSHSRSPIEVGCQWRVFGGNLIAEAFGPNAPIGQVVAKIQMAVSRIRVFSLDADKIAAPSPVQGIIELRRDGTGLASVLDGMRDEAPENFKAIESQIGEWLPEFDQILFDRPQQGYKSVALRTREGQYKVPASDLSQGTLIALALLTLAYHPTPPSLIALEEPDRGVHPHLLRHVQDTLHRLSHPESCGEKREPVQVIATTHNPFFLDLFRELPEEIVVANKVGLDVQFQRLSDQPHIHEYLEDTHLSDVWYSGILGGVPCRA
jgi:predicted ATPase